MARYTGLFRLYPIAGTSEDGFVENDVMLVKKSILNLLKTHKGSRVYDPDYGTNLHLLIHEQNIQRTRNIAKGEIESVIEKYEPRAKLNSINVTAGTGEKASEATISVNVTYTEYNITEELEIKLKGEQAWIHDDGTPVNPFAGKF